MEGFRVTRHGMEFYYKDNRHCEAAGTKETTRKVSVKSAEQYMFDRKDTIDGRIQGETKRWPLTMEVLSR